jgi:Trk K+ transport system NAD-binding subunit/nucleotide-binding universal stress UspA family protein
VFARVVIVGGGKTSESIVEGLSRVAPVVVLDTSEAELRSMTATSVPPRGDAQTSGPFRHPITTQVADGTSRLVLEDLRGDARDSVALVAATGEDRTNLEICRLAKELAYKPVVAIAIDPAEASKYDAHDARAIVRSTVLGQAVERAMQFEGLSIATTVGLGKGEIVEFKVLPSSAIVGLPLREIDANGWRIAAIYRQEKLVLPTGSTSIEADDRVIVVGEPRILPLVAENLRIGLPMFPLRHGPRVVVYLPFGRDRDTEHEAEVVTLETRATGLVRVWPGAKAERTILDDPIAYAVGSTESATKTFDDAPLEGSTLDAHVRSLLAARPGVVVTKVAARTLWDRVAGLSGRDGALCDALPCPVIFPRGGPHYRRIVYAIPEGNSDLGTADAAIDLARMFELPMEIVRVDLPSYMGKTDDADALVADVERRARLHQVVASTTRLEGNPIERIVSTTRAGDLVVVTRRRGARDGYTRPDVALRIARSAPCSTLVATLDDD